MSDADRSRAILDGLPDAVLCVDGGGRVVDVNPATQALLGWAPSELLGRSAVEVLPQLGRGPARRRMQAVHRGGHELPVSVAQSRVVIDGQSHQLVLLRDARSELAAELALEQTRKQLEIQATRDPLTEVWNRRAILQRLDAELHRARRIATPLSIAMIDLDHFKRVNDEYGHPAGDAVLRASVARAAGVLRHYDDLGRYGGEEFLLVLSRSDLDVAQHIAERLREAVGDQPIAVEGGQVSITLSVGVAALRPEETVEALLNRADQALYQAKEAGRNRVVVDRAA